MIFATIDCWRYFRKIGRYRKDALHNAVVCPTATLIETYRPLIVGTMLMIHTRESFLSWLVLYSTGGPVSHLCIVGPKTNSVLDMTTNGVLVHSLSDYFNNNSLVWAVVLPGFEKVYNDEFFQKFITRSRKFDYSWRTVITKGLIIFSGFSADSRIIHLLDFVILYLLLAAILFSVGGVAAYPLALAILHVTSFVAGSVKYKYFGGAYSFRLDSQIFLYFMTSFLSKSSREEESE